MFRLHGAQPHLSLYDGVFPHNLAKDRREMHPAHLSRKMKILCFRSDRDPVSGSVMDSLPRSADWTLRPPSVHNSFLGVFFFFLRRHLDIFSRVSANFKVGKTHHSRKNVDRVDF